MTLNRSDYPSLTDEQWDALNAEFDRARTQASQTARANATRGMVAESEVEERIQAALAAERERAEMDAAQRLEADRKAFEAQQQAFAATQRQFTAKTKLLEGGIPTDKVDAFLPLFANVEDKVLESTIDAFLGTYTETVKTQVDTEKQNLLGAATPPAGQTGAHVDMTTAALEAANSGDLVGAAELLLKSASLV